MGKTKRKFTVEDDCKRVYKYVEKESEACTMYGNKYTETYGFEVVHNIQNRNVRIDDLHSGLSFYCGSVRISSVETLRKLADTLHTIADSWEDG